MVSRFRLNMHIAKWWSYIYTIMEEFQQNVFSQTDLINTIQKFITESNLAEFNARLKLIYTFHCHSVLMKKTPQSGKYITLSNFTSSAYLIQLIIFSYRKIHVSIMEFI